MMNLMFKHSWISCEWDGLAPSPVIYGRISHEVMMSVPVNTKYIFEDKIFVPSKGSYLVSYLSLVRIVMALVLTALYRLPSELAVR